MTRINVVDPTELSDQWLLAEYRELPRIIKAESISTKDASNNYVLGKGHVKWAIKHARYCLIRYNFICKEMEYRGFKINYPFEDLYNLAIEKQPTIYSKSYSPTMEDINLNHRRLIEKYKMKPSFYKWTNRKKPEYLQ